MTDQMIQTAARIQELRRTTAAIWKGGDDISVESVAVPELGFGDVLVRVRLATVCGSDRHTVSGRRKGPHPSILGHETVADIVAMGADTVLAVDGKPLRVGHRVIWSVTLPCGTCDRCMAGVTAKCRTVLKAGHEALDSTWGLSGGYAQHVLLPHGLPIAIVDDDISDAVAAPAACATATVMAVTGRAGSLTGQRIMVIGAGMLGLTAAAVASSASAASVTVIDPDPTRRELSRQFGATDVKDSSRQAGTFDVLLELSGSSSALQDGITTLDTQGVAVFAGSVKPDTPIVVDPEAVVRRQLLLLGSHNYEPRHLSEALMFLHETLDEYPWEDLVAEPVPLDALHGLLTGPAGPKPRYSIDPR